MTDEETPEDDIAEPVPPQRMILADAAVLIAGFWRNVFNAFAQFADDLTILLAAHANYRRDQIAEKKAVAEFKAQLDRLPNAQ